MDRKLLEEAIVRVRGALSSHGAYLADEYRTRIVLVDPVLSALGWDVTDPDRVRLEEKENGNAIDYVLAKPDKSAFAVVEAKASKTGLDTHRKQASGYAVAIGAEYVILTNGLRWEAWKIVAGTPRKENTIAEVNISTGDSKEVAGALSQLSYDRLGDF